MATTGELRAIVQELHLVDVGDAESYLGEEALTKEESSGPLEEFVPVELVSDSAPPATCDCTSCDLVHV